MRTNEIRKEVCADKTSAKILWIFLWSFLFLFFHSAIGWAHSAPDVCEKVEAAVLAEDWAKVAELLNSVDPQTPSPVLRLIKGHACLALNKNNESFCLFLSASSMSDLQKWEEWTNGIVIKHPQKLVAHYFRGDALARLEKFDLAIDSFNKALCLNLKNPLVRHSRGVAYSAKKEWNLALNDFNEAVKAKPDFSDAHASRGAMYIQKKSGAKGAEKAYSEALRNSPDYVLALNGLASARIVLAKWDDAEGDLKEASKYAKGCLSVIRAAILQNLAILAHEKSEAISKALTQLANIEPGMSLTKKVEEFSKLSPSEVAILKGVLKDNIGFNQKYAFWAPDQTKFSTNVEGGIKGQVPFVGGKLGQKDNGKSIKEP